MNIKEIEQYIIKDIEEANFDRKIKENEVVYIETLDYAINNNNDYYETKIFLEKQNKNYFIGSMSEDTKNPKIYIYELNYKGKRTIIKYKNFKYEVRFLNNGEIEYFYVLFNYHLNYRGVLYLEVGETLDDLHKKALKHIEEVKQAEAEANFKANW